MIFLVLTLTFFDFNFIITEIPVFASGGQLQFY